MKGRSNDKRLRLIRLIHVARRDLGMEDEDYRTLLGSMPELGGKTSAKDLSIPGLLRVLDELKAKGFKVRGGRKEVSRSRQALASKIRALLMEADKPEAYADGIAKHMFGIERWEWCDPDQLHRIVAALVYQARREASRRREQSAQDQE
jgi:phage gp16-like protein